MKKLLKGMLCGILAVSMLSGCSSNNNDQSVEPTPTPEAETTGTVGEVLLATFNETMANNPEASALDIANAIIANPILLFGPDAVEVEPGFLTGFGNTEVTGFETAVMFGPVISTIPFVGYIFTLAEDADIDAFVTFLKDNANLRWNICTEAEELTVEKSGNTVFFLMSPLSLEDDAAE